ncbi:hypothetical protein JANAI62_12020 [Jannaschia pagri]|uniref:Type IV pilus biogenesis protein PilP n=1 Tax=Jannaschia pagri TaxID=2829797 RepID=A0ABQ4NJJ4_9RHOB|nr:MULTISPECIES: hypothetical protein [unclassified Jannaschia]GIT90747.1 hypothetical protein JANAI61_12050 [Jannaschia sp. AI_61]GIT94579.1 hypothetical protein JANAI62_12020 [Jannaschia sp. AI_62]
MTPQIALDLSLDGITVLSRAPEGAWWREGTVRLDRDDMVARLSALRDVAVARVGEDFTSILILPDSQLLYTSLERDDRRPEETIRSLLKGRTPYPVEDLTFDYIQRGDRLQVAVVALETLLEAETFAADYGFRPVAVVANPSDPAYPGIPNFGRTGLATEILGSASLDLDLTDGFKINKAPPLETAAPAPPLTVVPEPPAEEQPPEQPEAPADDTPVFTARKRAPITTAPPEGPARKTAAPAPTPVEAKEPAASPSAKDTKPVGDPPLVSPGFTSRRTSKPDDTLAPAPSGERLARVVPRLTPPGAADTKRAKPPAAPPTPAKPKPRKAKPAKAKTPKDPPPFTATPVPGETPAPRRPVGPAAPVSPPAEVADPEVLAQATSAVTPASPQPEVSADPEVSPGKPRVLPKLAKTIPAGRLGVIAARLKAAQAQAKAKSEPTEEDLARQAEAQALALPGLAREQAAAPPKSSAKLGLTLTLGLLATLVLVGLGSFLLGLGRSDAPSANLEDAAPDQVVAEAETIAPEETVQAPATIEVPAAVDTQAPVSDEAAEVDLALLLPQSDAAEAAGPEILGPAPSSAPVPILGRAPEAAPPGFAPGPQSEDQLLPEIVPDLAQAPALDAAPNADTTPAVFTEAFEADGLFTAPEVIAPPAIEASADDVVVAAIDPDLAAGDPVLLPAALPSTDAPAAQINPPPAAEAGNRDAALGLVTATPEGTLAPGGFTVVLGRPVVVPLPRPGGETEATDDVALDAQADGAETDAPAALTPEEEAAQQVLRRTRPVQRPDDAAELFERAQNNGVLIAELRRTRPTERPASVIAAATAAAAAIAAAEEASAAVTAAQQAAAASLANSEVEAATAAAAAATTEAPTEEADTGPVSELALGASERPRTRPRSVEREAARIVTARRERAAAATEAAASTSTPPARTVDRGQQTTRSAGGSVARAATERNVLRLNRINLIGVYGRPDARRALVRLANGRYVKVEVGDRLDRGRVTAIGDGQLSYQRGGRNVVLRLPRA